MLTLGLIVCSCCLATCTNTRVTHKATRPSCALGNPSLLYAEQTDAATSTDSYLRADISREVSSKETYVGNLYFIQKHLLRPLMKTQ